MTLHLRDMRTLAVAALLFSGGALLAGSHRDLNGNWKLIPARSDFAGQPAIETGTVTINDREHNIYVDRSFTYDGGNQTTSYNFSTDGRENSTIRNGKAFKSKAKWDGDVLVVHTTQDDQSVVERYSMDPDGTMSLVVERSGRAPVLLYFERQ